MFCKAITIECKMSDNTTKALAPGIDGLDELEMAFLIIYAVAFIPTVFGNLLILISIYKFPWLQSPLNYLVGNLAFSDLLIGLLLMPLDVMGTYFGLNSYEVVCLVQLTAMLTLLLTSLLSMLAIAVERCFSVTFPHKHRAMKLQPFVTTFIVLAWIFTLVISSLPLFGLDTFTIHGKCRYMTVWPQNYRYAINILIIVLVVTKVVFFSITVRVALKHMHNYNTEHDGVVLRRRMAKTYVLIIISAMFIVCWAPYCIVSWTKLFLRPTQFLTTVHGWTMLLAFFNAAINWLIYGLKNEKFRKAFGILLCRRNAVNIDERPSSS